MILPRETEAILGSASEDPVLFPFPFLLLFDGIQTELTKESAK